MPSLTVGSRSRPTSAGSRSAISPGALGPESATRAAWASPRARMPLPVPLGDEVERRRVGVLDPRALDVRVEPADVDELRAAPVRGRGERAHEVLLARLAADGHDLAGLHVGAEADDEVGEAREGRVVHRPNPSRVATFPLALGGVREWLNRAVSKTVVRATVPRVRIPPPPLSALERVLGGVGAIDLDQRVAVQPRAACRGSARGRGSRAGGGRGPARPSWPRSTRSASLSCACPAIAGSQRKIRSTAAVVEQVADGGRRGRAHHAGRRPAGRPRGPRGRCPRRRRRSCPGSR